MKLKEKLAAAFSSKFYHPALVLSNQEFEDGFIAGFEKAREMSIEAVEHYSQDRVFDYTNCNDLIVSNLIMLGEEEV